MRKTILWSYPLELLASCAALLAAPLPLGAHEQLAVEPSGPHAIQAEDVLLEADSIIVAGAGGTGGGGGESPRPLKGGAHSEPPIVDPIKGGKGGTGGGGGESLAR